ncbi:actin-like ATPase domain-containing protein [Dendrothele bispora CBS 962.96]|uniref:Actin-like ATPase domain-containing protein n=1 Tax=Dendrothele bispora (strain CBS 962.96) TaxID=1314807 RepID=A0A4S8LXD4_DENBC|nr:actin-like ATPase domain-containing protein [Dendrothele bispora CBS 962.96]
MSCCGTPKDTNNQITNRDVPPNQPFVNQQPGPVAGLEKPDFQLPLLSTPPPVHSPSSQPTWTSSPSPPIPAGSPSLLHSGMYSNFDSLTRPSSTFQSSGSPAPLMVSMAPQASPLYGQDNLNMDEGRMSVSIDFGTTFSGVAYGSSRIAGGQVQQILNWPGSFETFRKIPTCILYDDRGQVLAWGLEAKNAGPIPNTTRCEWFKLFLEPSALRDQSAVDPRLPQLPPGKKAIDVIIDFLSCLWEYAKEQITRDIGIVADLNSADVWLTVPAAWDAKGCEIMREAAIQAGLVQSSRAGDTNWKDRLRIITEPEAAAVHCAHLTDLHRLKPSQNFIVCDAGGGTVDLAVYKIIGQLAHLEIAEIAARSGANCGSLFLDLRFRELVKSLLADHPAHLDAASLAYFMHSFSETDKLAYSGVQDDENMFHFTCFNVEDPNDPTVGLIDGQLSIPGALLRREVFDPVVEQVLHLLEDQLNKTDQRIDALLLVGGFAGSEYLKQRVEEKFSSRIRVIARPADADTATLRGAARYGLARRPLVSSIIAPRSYIMKVKLPAESEDWQKRPAYIKNNDAGYPICENRLQYLVQKGAIIRKGQRLATKFCKYSQTPQDSTFVAVLYTSDSERVMRYNDEGETSELCKWTVDLSTLPAFQQSALLGQSGGFYTEFEIGLELDSAEVRGVLLHNNQEWGRVIFDYIN